MSEREPRPAHTAGWRWADKGEQVDSWMRANGDVAHDFGPAHFRYPLESPEVRGGVICWPEDPRLDARTKTDGWTPPTTWDPTSREAPEGLRWCEKGETVEFYASIHGNVRPTWSKGMIARSRQPLWAPAFERYYGHCVRADTSGTRSASSNDAQGNRCEIFYAEITVTRRHADCSICGAMHELDGPVLGVDDHARFKLGEEVQFYQVKKPMCATGHTRLEAMAAGAIDNVYCDEGGTSGVAKVKGVGASRATPAVGYDLQDFDEGSGL